MIYGYLFTAYLLIIHQTNGVKMIPRTERDNIVQWLASETVYLDDNKTRLQEMLKRQGEVVTLLADVEWKWFEVQQKLEESHASQ